MNAVETVMARMRQRPTAPAIYWQGQTVDYAAFCRLIDDWCNRLAAQGIGPGAVCGVLGDYSPQCCALLFALMRVKAILVPFTQNIEHEMPALLDLAGVQYLFRFDPADAWRMESFENVAQNQLVLSFLSRETPV
jgi:acyl-CoA synthetase (AMP-forming)/AMP-acid ligase II